MLTQEQENYLNSLPNDCLAEIKSWDPETKVVASDLTERIHSACPGIEVLFMGASALEISGQNDIDLYILSDQSRFGDYLSDLVGEFGQPAKQGKTSIKWELEVKGFDVELYLTDPNTLSMQEQIGIYQELRNDPSLLREYEEIKTSSVGLSLKEYQRRKYEFYNHVLGTKKH